MKKKIVALSIVVALLATFIVGGTLAYLTDQDSAENVFTVGNVDIELLESTLHRDNDDATNEAIIENAKTYQEYLAEAGENMVPGRWVMKAPYVHNIGKNAAYIRVVATMTKNVYDVLNITLYTTAEEQPALTFVENVDDDNNLVTLTFVYTEALEVDDITYYAPFWRFQVKPELDCADLEALDVLNVDNVITVRADAIQAEGFVTAAEAFAAFDAQNN